MSRGSIPSTLGMACAEETSLTFCNTLAFIVIILFGEKRTKVNPKLQVRKNLERESA